MNSAPVAIGETIGGRYRLEGTLGEGGMATVYRARHLGTGRPCALKLVHLGVAAHPKLVELFLREAQLGSKIGPNPHIVEVLDAAVDPAHEAPFLVMELLVGETLEGYSTRAGPMPRELVRELFLQLGDALGQAHGAGVVHRDLKPGNLFLTRDRAGRPLLKVFDFGIAKVLQEGAPQKVTQVGTLSYAAPEQLSATFVPASHREGIADAVGPTTDVWAMGLIAYELLTGHPSGHFWETDSPADVPLKVALGTLDPPSHRASERAGLLPPGFDAWFARCLRKNASERWPSAAEAVNELARILGPANGPSWYPPVPTGPPTPFVASATLAASTALPAGASYGFAGAAPASHYPPPAAPTYLAPPPDGAPAAQGASPYASAPTGYPTDFRAPQGHAGPPPYGAWPMPPPPPATPAKGASAAVWIVPLVLVGVLFLSTAGGVAYFGVKHVKELADIESCAKTKTACDVACEAGDAASCASSAYLHEVGATGTPKDVERAAALYDKACVAEDLGACAELGRFHLTGKGGVAHDEAKGVSLISRACDGGALRGCALLGELTRDGDYGVKADEPRAAKLFKRACDGEVMSACKHLGTMHEYGRGGLAKDLGRAATLFGQACEGGNSDGCNDLGVLYDGGRGVTKDQVRAGQLFKQACDASEATGCCNLAAMYESGTGGLPKDERRAKELYTQACDDGAALGCKGLGWFHENGLGGLTKDPAKAAALYKRACDGHLPQGCSLLGALEKEGSGVPKNDASAVAHYRMGCDGGHGYGCFGLGLFQEEGGGGLAKDDAKAAALYKRGCDLGGPLQSCSAFGILITYGRAGRDAAAALPYFQKACDGGNAAGCSNLGYFYVKGMAVARDRTRGGELLRRGCSSGYDWACNELRQNGLPKGF